jgi:hypothetical protein
MMIQIDVLVLDGKMEIETGRCQSKVPSLEHSRRIVIQLMTFQASLGITPHRKEPPPCRTWIWGQADGAQRWIRLLSSVLKFREV